MAEDWQVRETTRRARIRSVWVNTMLLALLAGVLFGVAAAIDDTATRLVLVAAGAVVSAVALVVGTVVYLRRIDEQERDANLWSAYVAVVLYMSLYMGQRLAAEFGLSHPRTHDFIFLASAATLVGVYLWKRFR